MAAPKEAIRIDPAVFKQGRCFSNWYTIAAATRALIAWPYCASQRVSRLTSPLKFSASVVGSPSRSRISSSTHAPEMDQSSTQFIRGAGYARWAQKKSAPVAGALLALALRQGSGPAIRQAQARALRSQFYRR